MPQTPKYILQDDRIVASWGWWRRRLQHLKASEISSWQIHPEMTFDIAEIHLIGGTTLRWLDHDGSLLTILRRVAPARETETPRVVEPLRPANGG